ncbi:MAG: VCBS repeat-containing protein [Desulfobulbaceae bacterium]|nr:VCBS repeat-containing protein [Desulfobulbaceae bacterium]
MIRFFIRLFVLLLVGVLPVTSCLAGSSVTIVSEEQVLFLPFRVKDASSYAYLQDGASNIVACRLLDRTNVKMVDWSPDTDLLSSLWVSGQEGEFRKALANTSGYNVLTGELREGTDGLSIILSFFSADNNFERKIFSSVATDERDILPVMDSLTWDISEKLFGVKRTENKAISTQSVVCAIGPTPHPDKLYNAGSLLPNSKVSIDEDKLPVFDSDSALTVWGAKDIALRSMTIGDIDGDGIRELVAISDSKLIVWTIGENSLSVKGILKLHSGLKTYSINLADINSNGRMEIYVTGTLGDEPSSWIIEWLDSKKSLYLLADYKGYLRPMRSDGGKIILAAQYSDNDNLLLPGVYELMVEKGFKVSRGREISLADQANIFNYARVDVDNDDKLEIVLIDEDNRLNLLSEKGELLWRSEDLYGISGVYLGKNLVDVEEGGERVLYHVPAQIVGADMNGDGRDDIIIAKNKLTSPLFMKNTRFVEGGEVEVLSWNGSGMDVMWSSNARKGNVVAVSPGVVKKSGKDDQKVTRDLFLCEFLRQSKFGVPLFMDDYSQIVKFSELSF